MTTEALSQGQVLRRINSTCERNASAHTMCDATVLARQVAALGGLSRQPCGIWSFAASGAFDGRAVGIAIGVPSLKQKHKPPGLLFIFAVQLACP